jgi:16S rRNA (guanine527-N7)-methyltransferase
MSKGCDIIFEYFPDLSDHQKEQMEMLFPLYSQWNEKINVISRKDMDNLYVHHILHSLAIAEFITFHPGADILDLGTGGGLPGIPLAILFPETHFTLIDGTGKKITVVREISGELGLTNITAEHIRAEEWKEKADFVISRAVAPLEKLMEWSRKIFKSQDSHGLPNGLICLKGGDLTNELAQVKKQTYVESVPLSTWFEEDFFQEKYLVYAQAF